MSSESTERRAPSNKAFAIRAASPDEIPAVEHLFQQIVAESTYYNEWAKRTELARYTAAKLAGMIAAEPESVLVACVSELPSAPSGPVERPSPLAKGDLRGVGPTRSTGHGSNAVAQGSTPLDRNELAGFCFSHNDAMGLIWLGWVGVNEGYRRRGVAEALVRRLIEGAPARGAHKVWCDTRIGNTTSQLFFQKLGFVVLCELRNHWYGLDYYLWQTEV